MAFPDFVSSMVFYCFFFVLFSRNHISLIVYKLFILKKTYNSTQCHTYKLEKRVATFSKNFKKTGEKNSFFPSIPSSIPSFYSFFPSIFDLIFCEYNT